MIGWYVFARRAAKMILVIFHIGHYRYFYAKKSG